MHFSANNYIELYNYMNVVAKRADEHGLMLNSDYILGVDESDRYYRIELSYNKLTGMGYNLFSITKYKSVKTPMPEVNFTKNTFVYYNEEPMIIDYEQDLKISLAEVNCDNLDESEFQYSTTTNFANIVTFCAWLHNSTEHVMVYGSMNSNPEELFKVLDALKNKA